MIKIFVNLIGGKKKYYVITITNYFPTFYVIIPFLVGLETFGIITGNIS